VAVGEGCFTQLGPNEAVLQLGYLGALGSQNSIDPAVAYPLFQPTMLTGQ